MSGTCYDCKYYTDSLGPDGYCTLYRHNLSSDIKCSKFERKDLKDIKNTGFDIKSAMLDLQTNIKNDRKKALRHMLWIASVFSCLVFTVMAIIFAIITGTAIMSFDSVAITMRAVFIATVCFFLLSFLLISFMLVYRFTASLCCVVFMLLNESLLWFNFHDLMVGLIKEIFNIVL